MNKALFFWLAVLLLFAGATTIWAGYQAIQSADTQLAVKSTRVAKAPGKGQKWLTSYTLTDQTGESFNSQEELDGQVHVVSFFFASCPHFCTFQNKKQAEIYEQFADQGVKFVSITCDPVTDTPARLNEYSQQFKAKPDSWVFLTGDADYIRRIGAEMYQVAVAPLTHSERFIVVDRWGKIRGTFHWNQPDKVAEMQTLLTQLLAEKNPPAEEPAAEAAQAEPVEAAGPTGPAEAVPAAAEVS